MVLRFYAYVKEPLLGVAPEAHRIRRCVILHYLEDATLAINEPRQPSSDTPYGPILKRHKSDIRLESLRVGKSVTLFSRTYNIISADAFTGRFMESHGLPLDADIAAPEDPQERRERERRAVQHTRKAQRPRPLIDKDAFDAMQLYYYLSDDTVEVVEVLRRNCGRDPFPHMLRRMRVPKCPEPVGGCPPSAGSSIKPPEAFYRWHELHIGSHVEVFGRKLMVYDCDAFTRHYQRLQIADDALKPILVLRFSAVLHPRPGSCPADAAIDRERSFVVSFFLADNSLSIFEHAQPNSGFQGGRFLERRRIMNPEASTFYEPQDMRVGSTIHTAGR
ncbi:hypothetical protein WJX75_004594 [Coccomyxa subellipsoidea]|uniref:DM10 domain-containing protein n=1 Tax=Coccomyxa subellipsoidea TaxID=248742 RepID=A0ABR2YAY2_9CHLO